VVRAADRDLAAAEDVLSEQNDANPDSIRFSSETMSDETALWRQPATGLTEGYRSGAIDPQAALEAVLARRAEVDPVLNAVVTLDAEGARRAASESATRWRAGRPLSPIDGVPVTIKDNIPVAGLRSTWGSLLFGDYVPQRDELPVAKLRAAGAVIVGKSNVPEFTLQGYTDNRLFGPTRNPWDPALTPGGSSGGAVAAVAAGIAPVAIGTDGGGSIRRPSSHVGLVGLKPTVGRVPRVDGFPAILLDFEVIGPIARCVDDLIAVMSAMSEADVLDPLSAPFAGRPFEVPQAVPRCRILYVPRFGDSPVDPQIATSVATAAQGLEALGHRIDEGTGFDLADGVNQIAWPVISQTGLAWLMTQYPGREAELTDPLRSMLESARKLDAAQYLGALDEVGKLRRRFAALFEQIDIVMTPTTAALPWPAQEVYPSHIDGREVGPRGHAVFTAFVNAAGLPAITVPSEPSREGLPIGFQLIGRPGADGLLCAVAREFEAAHPWAERWPAL
jgi:aspartyl-tRNA(Asn)/glutamyl-tRNA(Gln) amidotransferase subunit A